MAASRVPTLAAAPARSASRVSHAPAARPIARADPEAARDAERERGLRPGSERADAVSGLVRGVREPGQPRRVHLEARARVGDLVVDVTPHDRNVTIRSRSVRDPGLLGWGGGRIAAAARVDGRAPRRVPGTGVDRVSGARAGGVCGHGADGAVARRGRESGGRPRRGPARRVDGGDTAHAAGTLAALARGTWRLEDSAWQANAFVHTLTTGCWLQHRAALPARRRAARLVRQLRAPAGLARDRLGHLRPVPGPGRGPGRRVALEGRGRIRARAAARAGLRRRAPRARRRPRAGARAGRAGSGLFGEEGARPWLPEPDWPLPALPGRQP